MTNPQFPLQLGESLEQLTKFAMDGKITGFAFIITTDMTHNFPLIQTNWKDPAAFLGVMYGLQLGQFQVLLKNQQPDKPIIEVVGPGGLQ